MLLIKTRLTQHDSRKIIGSTCGCFINIDSDGPHLVIRSSMKAGWRQV